MATKKKTKCDTVSIVIPMYNEEKFIEPLINSILNQDYDLIYRKRHYITHLWNQIFCSFLKGGNMVSKK